jgi:hypothetical protein
LWKILWDKADTLGLSGFEPTDGVSSNGARNSATDSFGGEPVEQTWSLCGRRGLYLRVGRNGSKSWTFRFMLNGKAREMGSRRLA